MINFLHPLLQKTDQLKRCKIMGGTMTEWMEPINNPIAIEAAKFAAGKNNTHGSRSISSTHNYPKGHLHYLRFIFSALSYFLQQCYNCWITWFRKWKSQADACLNGNKPYSISLRLTGINFLVLCSIWYLYIDQLRLALFPHSADHSLAIVSW